MELGVGVRFDPVKITLHGILIKVMKNERRLEGCRNTEIGRLRYMKEMTTHANTVGIGKENYTLTTYFHTLHIRIDEAIFQTG